MDFVHRFRSVGWESPLYPYTHIASPPLLSQNSPHAQTLHHLNGIDPSIEYPISAFSIRPFRILIAAHLFLPTLSKLSTAGLRIQILVPAIALACIAQTTSRSSSISSPVHPPFFPNNLPLLPSLQSTYIPLNSPLHSRIRRHKRRHNIKHLIPEPPPRIKRAFGDGAGERVLPVR